AGILSFWLYKRAGYFEEGAFGKIWGSVRKSAVKSTISILALVATAVIMSHAGMTQLIARGISETFSAAVYPLFTPFIGTLGAFITGSNTNSNVLFGDLQRETAQLLGLSIPIILAGQTAGASLGSVLAPAKIIVGCSTVGLTGQEGPVIRQMILLGLIPVVFVALLTWGLAAAM
ncbi:MAG: L-lactate permease, partial [Chloroflexota bacterium]